MTDGIIQKVFDKLFNEQSAPYFMQDMYKLQQELIETIKQEFKLKEYSKMDFSGWKDGYNDATTDYLEKLIGDSKE